jgi:Na+-driven multidrug efflux pump
VVLENICIVFVQFADTLQLSHVQMQKLKKGIDVKPYQSLWMIVLWCFLAIACAVVAVYIARDEQDITEFMLGLIAFWVLEIPPRWRT